MNTMNNIEKIKAVQNTMAQVSVAGPENWNRMLGCWQTLEEVKKELMEHESTDAPVQQRDSENAADPV